MPASLFEKSSHTSSRKYRSSPVTWLITYFFFEHGTNGFLVDLVNQWSDHVVELQGSPETRDKLASNAKRDLQEKMSLEFFSQRLYKFALETAASRWLFVLEL